MLQDEQRCRRQRAASGLIGAPSSPWLEPSGSTRERAGRGGAAGYLQTPLDQGVLPEAFGWAIGEG